MRRFTRSLALAAMLFAAAPASLTNATDPGAVVPFFKGTDLQGRPVVLGDLIARQRVAVLFWDWRRATSVRAMQVCDLLQTRFGNQGLEVLAIEGEGSSTEVVLERVERLRAIGNAQRYTIVPDPKGSIARQFGVESTPQIFLLDGAGRVVLHLEGFKSEDEAVLEDSVKGVLGLATPAPAAPSAQPQEPAVAAQESAVAPARPEPAEDSTQARLEKYRYFGNYYLNKDEPAKAEEYYRRYVALAPDDASAWLQIGEACARQQRYDQAREAWEQVLRIEPRNREADANIRRLIRGEY